MRLLFSDALASFFHFYRTFAFPFNPILIDLGQFEASLCRYLIAYNSGTFSTSSYQSEEWASKKSTAYISLVLSTLASGTQFSDLNRAERARISQDFGTLIIPQSHFRSPHLRLLQLADQSKLFDWPISYFGRRPISFCHFSYWEMSCRMTASQAPLGRC